MTVIDYRQVDGRRVLSLRGHAAFHTGGPDIVCSAVSVLVCTLAACLEDEDAKGHLRHLVLELRDGDVHMEWQPEEWSEEHIAALWQMAETGLTMLSEQYPANVEWGN